MAAPGRQHYRVGITYIEPSVPSSSSADAWFWAGMGAGGGLGYAGPCGPKTKSGKPIWTQNTALAQAGSKGGENVTWWETNSPGPPWAGGCPDGPNSESGGQEDNQGSALKVQPGDKVITSVTYVPCANNAPGEPWNCDWDTWSHHVESLAETAGGYQFFFWVKSPHAKYPTSVTLTRALEPNQAWNGDNALFVAEYPLYCVAVGTGKALENYDSFKSHLA